MKAYILESKKLELKEIAKPEIKANQVLIKTKAISLNPVDYKVTQGTFNLSTPRIVGIDVAGEVIETGKDVTEIKIGDSVFGMINIFETGSFAEYVAVDSEVLSIMPENLTFRDASTIPCAGVTAWQAINEKVNIRQGQTVFITAGGGGVGGFAIQFAKRLGAKVITSASKDFDRILKLGADYIINYKASDVADEIMQITNNKGVDYIINCISSTDIVRLAKVLRFNGVIVGITGIPGEYPYAPFSKAAGLIEVALVAAYTGGDKESLREVAIAGERIAELMVTGEVSANITKEFTFPQLNEGLQLFAESKSSGKIVVML